MMKVSLHRMQSLNIFNPFTPKGFLIGEKKHLVFDRVKSRSVSGTYRSETAKGHFNNNNNYYKWNDV